MRPPANSAIHAKISAAVWEREFYLINKEQRTQCLLAAVQIDDFNLGLDYEPEVCCSALACGISIESFFFVSRVRAIVLARKIAMRLLNERGVSYEKAAQIIGINHRTLWDNNQSFKGQLRTNHINAKEKYEVARALMEELPDIIRSSEIHTNRASCGHSDPCLARRT